MLHNIRIGSLSDDGQVSSLMKVNIHEMSSPGYGPPQLGWLGDGRFGYEPSAQPREKLVSRDGGRLQLILNRLHDDAINMDCGSESVYVLSRNPDGVSVLSVLRVAT